MKKFVTVLASGVLIAALAGCTDNLASLLSGGSTGTLDSLIHRGRRTIDSTRHDGGMDSTSGRGVDTTRGDGRGRSDSTEVHGGDHGADTANVRHDGGISDTLNRGHHDGGVADSLRGRDGGDSDTTRHDGGGGHRGRH